MPLSRLSTGRRTGAGFGWPIKRTIGMRQETSAADMPQATTELPGIMAAAEARSWCGVQVTPDTGVRRAVRLLCLALVGAAALLTEGCTPTPGQLLLGRIRAVLDLPTLADAHAVARTLGVRLGRHSAWKGGEGWALTSGSLAVGPDSLISIAAPVASLIVDPSVSASFRDNVEERRKVKPPLRLDLPRVFLNVYISPDRECITMNDLVKIFGAKFLNYINNVDLKFFNNTNKHTYNGKYVDIAVFNLERSPYQQISFQFSGLNCVQYFNIRDNDWHPLWMMK